MNLWSDFDDLRQRELLQVAQVVAHNADGTSTVAFPNGSQLTVRGQAVAVAGHAFVRDGQIQGEAPATTPVVLEV